MNNSLNIYNNAIIVCLVISSIIVGAYLLSKKPDDYYTSMSIKEFLYETDYIMVIEKEKITKYDDHSSINTVCSDPTIIEFIDKDNNLLSSFLYIPEKHDDVWLSIENTNAQMKVFTFA